MHVPSRSATDHNLLGVFAGEVGFIFFSCFVLARH